mgnify:CR=1 FL=1
MYARQLAEFPAGKLAPQAQYERLSTLYNDGKYQEVLDVAAQVAAPPPEYADNVYWMSAESAVAPGVTVWAVLSSLLVFTFVYGSLAVV